MMNGRVTECISDLKAGRHIRSARCWVSNQVVVAGADLSGMWNLSCPAWDLVVRDRMTLAEYVPCSTSCPRHGSYVQTDGRDYRAEPGGPLRPRLKETSRRLMSFSVCVLRIPRGSCQPSKNGHVFKLSPRNGSGTDPQPFQIPENMNGFQTSVIMLFGTL